MAENRAHSDGNEQRQVSGPPRSRLAKGESEEPDDDEMQALFRYGELIAKRTKMLNETLEVERSDPVVLKIGRDVIRLSENELTCVATESNGSFVMARKWIRDGFMNLFGMLVQHDQPLVHFVSSFWLDNSMPEIRHAGGLFDHTRTIVCDEQSDVRFIYIVVNNMNAHWVLIVVDVRAQRIYGLDSLPDEKGTARLRILLSVVASELSLKNTLRFPHLKWVCTIMSDCPKQQNGFDCGVYVCHFMRTLANALDMDQEALDVPKIIKDAGRPIPTYRLSLITEIKKYVVIE